jgi:hypothetical protein
MRRATSNGEVTLSLRASDTERDMLTSALSAAGAAVRAHSAPAGAGGRTARLTLDARLVAQVLVVAGVAVAGHFAGAPSVPWLAVPAIGALFLSNIELAERAFDVPPGVVEEKLGGVESAAWQEATAVRRKIEDPEAISAVRECVAVLRELVERLRDGGRHLVLADAGLLDRDLHVLLRQSLRLAAAIDRVSAASELADRAPERRARLLATRTEMLKALDGIVQKLNALKISVVELHGMEARNEILVGASARLNDIQVAVEKGIELASFVGDPIRPGASPAT